MAKDCLFSRRHSLCCQWKIVAAEWGGGKAVFVPKVDDRVVGPAEAHGYGLGDLIELVTITVSPSIFAVGVIKELAVLAGDREARELVSLSVRGPGADVLEMNDRLATIDCQACSKIGPEYLDLFAA